MPTIGVNIAILQNDKILLTKREDFEVWCLPGGSVDQGESLVKAARREACEEVGLEVEITRLVGIYSESQWYYGGLHIALFLGRVVAGELKLDPREVLEARFFSASELPKPLMYGHYQRILDAINGVGGSVVWSQDRIWPFEPGATRKDIYELRDHSGLTRQEFYLQYFGHLGTDFDQLEVGSS